MTESVVMLSPEPPYPLHGGGAFRIASLVHYFAQFADVDLILFSNEGRPAELPRGLVRRQIVIPLPVNSKSTLSRYLRNARRAAIGIPPLVDRLAGMQDAVARALRGQHYDLGVVEHSWAAGYWKQLAEVCDKTVLDLHNIESSLHLRCATTSTGLIAAGHRRFAVSSRKFEAEVLPQFSLVVTTSEQDRLLAQQIAPTAVTAIYPNAYPFTYNSSVQPEPATVVLSGNFEYHPNIDAVGFLMREIWPAITTRHPKAKLRLVGRGADFVRKYTGDVSGVEVTGLVENALSEIARATVVIAPLRTGSGTRIKILEAWAAGRPVVATPLAAEGLIAESGVNLAVAANAGDFADAVCRLLSDRSERDRLGEGGRRTLTENYTWDVAWRTLDATLQVTRCRELSRYTG